jgi:hypothetical protein
VEIRDEGRRFAWLRLLGLLKHDLVRPSRFVVVYHYPATDHPQSQPCHPARVKFSALQWVARKNMPFLSAIAWPGDSGATCVGAVTQSTKPLRKAGGRAAEALAQILYRRPPARDRFGKTLCFHPRSEVVQWPFTLSGFEKGAESCDSMQRWFRLSTG